MRDDPAFVWLKENDPSALGLSAEEYRRRCGIETMSAEVSDTRRHRPLYEADRLVGHCPDCLEREIVHRHTAA